MGYCTQQKMLESVYKPNMAVPDSPDMLNSSVQLWLHNTGAHKWNDTNLTEKIKLKAA